jgi:hypothetical protein
MSKTNTFENDIQLLIFNNVDIADLGDATGVQGSGGAGSLYVGLLTADPTEAGTQTNEATFGSYARQAVVRSGSGWTVTNDQVENAAEIAFPEATSGSETVTHFGIFDSLTSGTMLYHGALDTSRAVSSGVTVRFAAGALTITED